MSRYGESKSTKQIRRVYAYNTISTSTCVFLTLCIHLLTLYILTLYIRICSGSVRLGVSPFGIALGDLGASDHPRVPFDTIYLRVWDRLTSGSAGRPRLPGPAQAQPGPKGPGSDLDTPNGAHYGRMFPSVTSRVRHMPVVPPSPRSPGSCTWTPRCPALGFALRLAKRKAQAQSAGDQRPSGANGPSQDAA